jgi:hypothetical protein
MSGMLVEEYRNTVTKEEENKSPAKSPDDTNHDPKLLSKPVNAPVDHLPDVKKDT